MPMRNGKWVFRARASGVSRLKDGEAPHWGVDISWVLPGESFTVLQLGKFAEAVLARRIGVDRHLVSIVPL